MRDMGDALGMITAEKEYTITPGPDGMMVRDMPSGLAPECYVTNTVGDEKIIHVGPWGPLFWAAAGIRQMLAYAQAYNSAR